MIFQDYDNFTHLSLIFWRIGSTVCPCDLPWREALVGAPKDKEASCSVWEKGLGGS